MKSIETNFLDMIRIFIGTLAILISACAQTDVPKKVKEASTKYTFEGLIVNIPVIATEKFEYSRTGELVRSTTNNCSGTTQCFKVIQEYDTLENLIRFQSFNNNELSVTQQNTYNDRDDLVTEFRVEGNDESQDTVLFEYIYLYGAPGESFLGYRLNNGDTVTKYHYIRNDSIRMTREEAYPAKGYTIVTIEKQVLNERGWPMEIHTQRISSDWQDETKIDTTQTLLKYTYNEAGQKIKEEAWENDRQTGSIISSYENEAIKQKIVNNMGQNVTIKYEHTYW